MSDRKKSRKTASSDESASGNIPAAGKSTRLESDKSFDARDHARKRPNYDNSDDSAEKDYFSTPNSLRDHPSTKDTCSTLPLKRPEKFVISKNSGALRDGSALIIPGRSSASSSVAGSPERAIRKKHYDGQEKAGTSGMVFTGGQWKIGPTSGHEFRVVDLSDSDDDSESSNKKSYGSAKSLAAHVERPFIPNFGGAGSSKSAVAKSKNAAGWDDVGRKPGAQERHTIRTDWSGGQEPAVKTSRTSKTEESGKVPTPARAKKSRSKTIDPDGELTPPVVERSPAETADINGPDIPFIRLLNCGNASAGCLETTFAEFIKRREIKLYPMTVFCETRTMQIPENVNNWMARKENESWTFFLSPRTPAGRQKKGVFGGCGVILDKGVFKPLENPVYEDLEFCQLISLPMLHIPSGEFIHLVCGYYKNSNLTDATSSALTEFITNQFERFSGYCRILGGSLYLDHAKRSVCAARRVNAMMERFGLQERITVHTFKGLAETWSKPDSFLVGNGSGKVGESICTAKCNWVKKEDGRLLLDHAEVRVDYNLSKKVDGTVASIKAKSQREYESRKRGRHDRNSQNIALHQRIIQDKIKSKGGVPLTHFENFCCTLFICPSSWTSGCGFSTSSWDRAVTHAKNSHPNDHLSKDKRGWIKHLPIKFQHELSTGDVEVAVKAAKTKLNSLRGYAPSIFGLAKSKTKSGEFDSDKDDSFYSAEIKKELKRVHGEQKAGERNIENVINVHNEKLKTVFKNEGYIAYNHPSSPHICRFTKTFDQKMSNLKIVVKDWE